MWDNQGSPGMEGIATDRETQGPGMQNPRDGSKSLGPDGRTRRAFCYRVADLG